MCQSTNLTCPTCHLLRNILIPCDPRLAESEQRTCRDLKNFDMQSTCQGCNTAYDAAYARTAGDAEARRRLVSGEGSRRGGGWQEFVREDVVRACRTFGVKEEQVLYA